MSTKSATLAKSLHTVSVLVAVARKLATIHDNLSPRSLIDEALAVLGYDGADDPHGLAAKAVAQLQRETARTTTVVTRDIYPAHLYDVR